jgi:leucyl-tRNA synthetase
MVTLVVQINGRLRDRLSVSASITQSEAEQLAMASDKVKPFIDGKKVERVVYVQAKLVNLVVK